MNTLRLVRRAWLALGLVAATASASRAQGHYCSYLQTEYVEEGGNACPPPAKRYTLHVYEYCCTGKLVRDTVSPSACYNSIAVPPPGQCSLTAVPCPACDDVVDACDGLDAGGTGRADEGCGDDEEGCGGRDRDENPVRFDGGSVESRVYTLAAVPGKPPRGRISRSLTMMPAC